MNYWLIKSEPAKYSWEQFKKDKKTTGIIKQNNPKPLRSMSPTIGFTPIKINQLRRLSRRR